MKKNIPLLSLIIALGIPAAITTFNAGCAATRTRESTGEYIDDRAISTKVKAALLRDKTVSGFAVEVNVFRGVVQLGGFVDNQTQRQRAEEIARGVAGVQSVENNISVKERNP
ncbi:BON domain-containing protein [Horticoccus luteus]|uniref:Osmotically-inducible protein Y n=1 Tax=Horticoccus luteus TaxID=2862869 RepID=A0A8F9XKL8_9BACT|nr:BON domain-containing protein [Horticoccus luteus]QYM79823.1 BON domain-containing protein [Horticoccus luteus]